LKRIAAALLGTIAPAALLAGCTTPAADAPLASTAPLTTQPLPASVPSDLPRTARPLHYAISVVPDAANLAFTGSTVIDVEVFERTNTLVLNAVDLTFSSASLAPANAGGQPVALRTSVDADAQTVTLTAPAAFGPGAYRVELAYSGIINTQANGLFALDYPDKRTGQQVRGLFTQFEAPDARRFAPMFDEPSYKATFDLTATVPEGQMALSNMPVAGEQSLGNGTKRVTFRTSPKMSSYLLFFGLGDFERVTKQAAGGTEVGIVAPTGSGSQSQYALDTLAPLVGYYNDYFGVNYPLPKLDNIAGPGESQFFGAMENWGAVFTFERILLEDPAIASAASRQQLYTTQAHEVAHQWFGDIVTMAWWDDLWLNEGFASWMETKATDHFNPEWHALLTRVGGREGAMDLDSLVTTHPVVQQIRTVSETNQAFDAITYQKGEAVIAMLEAYAGEDVWRQGIRAYMQQHKYGNTVSDDLWQAVEAAGARGLTDIAHDFTRQPGVPLVRAEATCANDSTQLALTQGEFSRDRREEVAARPTQWRVPLLVQVGSEAPVREVLQGQTTLTLPGCGPVIVNSGQLGYYRTLYAAPAIAQLATAMPTLQPIDQLGLMRDNWSLAVAGYQPAGPALDLLAAIPASANPVVTDSAVARWGAAYSLLETDTAPNADQGRLRDMAVAKYLPVLRRLGFEQRQSDTVADANLRAELIATLGKMGEPTVLAEGNRLFTALASDPRALDGPLKATWLALTARNATPQQWDLLARLARESSSTTERQTYYQRLGAVADEALARRALDLALSGEAGTSSARIISAVASEHPEMAYDWAIEHREQVNALVDNSARARYFAGLASYSSEPGTIDKLRTLRTQTPADEQVAVDRVIGGIEQRTESDPRMREQIAGWLRLEAR